MPPRPIRRALVVATTFALVVALVFPAPAVVADAEPTPEATHEGPVAVGDDLPGDAGARQQVGQAAQTERAARSERSTSDAEVDPGSGDERRVELVTGETVVVHDRGGERSYEVVSGGSVRVVTANERTFLLPEGVDLGTYDRSLFEVDALLAAQGHSGGEGDGNGGGEGDGTGDDGVVDDGNGIPLLLRTDASTAEVEAAGLRNARRLESAGVIAAEIAPARAGSTIPDLVGDGLVTGVSLDREVGPPSGVTGGVTPPATPRNLTGEGVTVAVLDTGVDGTHPDLAGNVVDYVDLVDGDASDGGGEDASDGTERPWDGEADASDGNDDASAGGGVGANESEPARDTNGHGTYVAGVLAGSGNDDGEHAGVAPGADVLDVRVMDDRGGGRASTIIEGIEYAVERDVDVILLSVGTSIDGSDEIADSVGWATERGVVVVAAAGNAGGPRTIGAPGRPGAAITVGATDGDGAVASYSSRGPTLDGGLKPDLVAPGRQVVGPRSSNSGRVGIDDEARYTWVSGTSAAAPQVAGAAALLLEAEPGLTGREVEARLASAARPVQGSAYAQGGGELDVDGALDPDVVVYDSVVDFGLVTDDGTHNRTITVANHDDRRHELSFDVAVRNVDLGVDANGTARLNETRLSLGPGERANLTLSVDGDTASGAHAGAIRYAVDGEPRSVAFGFVRGGTVTVEKRPLSPGARVDGDALWVLTEEGTHDELLEFENGTASFVAGGGTYLLWSWGTDEPTDATVFVSERRGFDGPTRVVLDEAETVPVGVDAGRIAERYGPLRNLSVTASMSAPYAEGVAKMSTSDLDADSRTVRVSRDPKLDVATTYLLTTDPGRSPDLDVSDVFQLAHAVEGVGGPSMVDLSLAQLETTEHRLHRTTVDETYRVQDRLRIAGVWNQIERRWFDLGGRRLQRVHRFPAGATYHRTFKGEGWEAHRNGRTSNREGRSVARDGWSVTRHGPSADSEARDRGVTTADVLSHPMHGLVETLRVEDGNLTVAGTPFSDGSGTRFDPPGDHRMTVAVDGEVVREERVRGGTRSLDGVAVEPGEDLTVRIVGNHSDGRLSTRTLTEVAIRGYDPTEDRYGVDVNRPPVVSDVTVMGTDTANAVRPGEVTAAFEVDAVGPAINPVVWYSVASPAEPPWRNRSGWERADTEWFGGRLLATFPVDEGAEAVSIASSVGDIRNHRTRTMTVDAVHVGEAPNTSTSMLRGRLLAPDGTVADNDTVVVDPTGSGSTRYVSTGPDGRFAVELPRDRSYDLTYVRGGPWVASEPTGDGRPAWLPLTRVTVDDDVDLGERPLPAAGELVVSVTDERGEPVPGASVRVGQRAGNVSATEGLRTGEDGLARRVGIDDPGIRLAGNVELVVEPPDHGRYPEQTHRRNVTVDGGRVVNVTLGTAPPEAVLAAYGSFEAGDPVFLHARKSQVPAGVAEYRWDVDGDGTVDRVTEEPRVRFVPDEGTLRPILTVVDRAGKTDASTLTLRIEPGEVAGSGNDAAGGNAVAGRSETDA